MPISSNGFTLALPSEHICPTSNPLCINSVKSGEARIAQAHTQRCEEHHATPASLSPQSAPIFLSTSAEWKFQPFHPPAQGCRPTAHTIEPSRYPACRKICASFLGYVVCFLLLQTGGRPGVRLSSNEVGTHVPKGVDCKYLLQCLALCLTLTVLVSNCNCA